jgi:hypothetical protein
LPQENCYLNNDAWKEEKMLKIVFGFLFFMWLGVHYYIVTGIYHGLAETPKETVVEEGQVDYENMTPEELQEAFDAMQKEQQEKLAK